MHVGPFAKTRVRADSCLTDESNNLKILTIFKMVDILL